MELPMTKRVQEKSKLINMPKTGETLASAASAQAPLPAPLGATRYASRPPPPEILPGGRTFTGVGEMMGSLGKASPLGQELEAAKAKLRTFEGAALMRRLDPKTIVRSRWANRNEAEFATAEFAAFKTEIESAGGNVQPIGVRLVSGVFDGQTPSGRERATEVFDGQTPTLHEIVFGHRRHQACLELGLPVTSMVVDVDDIELFQAMDRENRLRKSLSPWEQGMMYRRALDEGLFPSLRKLAEVLDVNLSVASQSVAIARLPADVVYAFGTPLDIQFRWAAPLAEAVQKDPEGVLGQARAIRARACENRQAKAVFAELLSLPALDAAKMRQLTLEKDGKVVALLKVKTKGRLSIEIHHPVNLEKAEAAVRKLLGL